MLLISRTEENDGADGKINEIVNQHYELCADAVTKK